MAEEEFVGNTDELIAQMEAEENEGAKYLSPRDYAKLRGMTPQLVYYHIRVGHIIKFPCECGRPVIDVAEADEYFRKENGGDQVQSDEDS